MASQISENDSTSSPTQAGLHCRHSCPHASRRPRLLVYGNDDFEATPVYLKGDGNVLTSLCPIARQQEYRDEANKLAAEFDQPAPTGPFLAVNPGPTIPGWFCTLGGEDRIVDEIGDTVAFDFRISWPVHSQHQISGEDGEDICEAVRELVRKMVSTITWNSTTYQLRSQWQGNHQHEHQRRLEEPQRDIPYRCPRHRQCQHDRQQENQQQQGEQQQACPHLQAHVESEDMEESSTDGTESTAARA